MRHTCSAMVAPLKFFLCAQTLLWIPCMLWFGGGSKNGIVEAEGFRVLKDGVVLWEVVPQGAGVVARFGYEGGGQVMIDAGSGYARVGLVSPDGHVEIEASCNNTLALRQISVNPANVLSQERWLMEDGKWRFREFDGVQLHFLDRRVSQDAVSQEIRGSGFSFKVEGEAGDLRLSAVAERSARAQIDWGAAPGRFGQTEWSTHLEATLRGDLRAETTGAGRSLHWSLLNK